MKTYIAKIDGIYYAFGGDTGKDQVYSIGSDKPPKGSGSSCYFARWTNWGIMYVASPSASKASATAKAKRFGEYTGEV